MKKSSVITDPIIYTASRLEAIANHFVFAPMKTSLASMKILRILEREGPLTPKRILELSGGTKSNISQRLNYLESNKFIDRDYAVVPNDKRRVVVKLTLKGRDRLKAIDKRLKRAQMCLNKFFSKKEIQNHVKFCEKLNKVIDNEEKNLTKIFN